MALTHRVRWLFAVTGGLLVAAAAFIPVLQRLSTASCLSGGGVIAAEGGCLTHNRPLLEGLDKIPQLLMQAASIAVGVGLITGVIINVILRRRGKYRSVDSAA